MSNEPLGIYAELREKAKRIEEREKERRALRLGPAWNGAYSMPINPFGGNGHMATRIKEGGFHRRHNDDRRRRTTWPEARLGVDIHQVVQAVVIETGLTHADLFSPLRVRRIAWPRHVCMWLIDRYCPQYSLPEVGYLFRRDHTSVMHGIKMVEQRLADRHHETRELVANVKRRLAALAEGEQQMTDIVQRLRFWPTRPAIMGEIRRDIVDAADEIERLRRVLDRIEKFIVAIAPKPTKEHVAICKEIQHALGESEG